MKHLKHLSEIYQNYDTFIIDLWGVMHNGINLIPEANIAVDELSKVNKKIIFLSNAPRPNENVIKFLKKLKMNDKFLNYVYTSGQAAYKSIKNKKYGDKFYHLGPPRDECLFEGIETSKVSLENCDFILCTGLFDEKKNDLNYYEELLRSFTKKKLICTNPDLIVDKGETREHCAGALAKIFEELGGQVIYYGKPHDQIYNTFLTKKNKALAIGDNLRTDIKGANNLNIDSIFITDGVHKNEIKEKTSISNLLKKYNVMTNYYQSTLRW